MGKTRRNTKQEVILSRCEDLAEGGCHDLSILAEEFDGFLMFGSLLGAVRGDGFIQGSGDIDVGVLAEKMSEVDRFAFDEAFDYEDVSSVGIVNKFNGRNNYFNLGENPIINVQVFYRIGDRYYFMQDDGLIQGGFKLLLEDNKKLSFLGNDFLIPANYEELLEEWYGKDWRIPKKGIHATLQNYELTPTTKENEEN